MAEKKRNEKTISIEQLRYLRSMEKQKLNQLTRRKRIVMQMMSENATVKESLKELGKGNKETIIPIGAGIYVSGSVVQDSFKRTLPGNVVLPSSQEEVEKELVERDKIYSNDLTQMDSEIMETRQNLNGMNALLQMNRKKGNKA